MNLKFKFNLKSTKIIRNQKGVALIMATSAITLMAWLATEISYDASVEYTVNSQNLNRVKAYYAAKSAVDLGLLRVKVYQQVSASPMAQQFAQYIDEIWKFKLIWPLPIDVDSNAVDKDNFEEAKKESLFDANWDLEIIDEGSKIDLSDLVSKSKTLSEISRQQLLNILKQKYETDIEFANRNENITPEALIDNITDWQSDKISSVGGGGNKVAKFTSLGPDFPPNRGFRTLEEVRLVPGMTNEIFELLKPNITIYGMKALNPNTSDIKLLKSLDEGLTDEVMKEVETFRNDPLQAGFKGDDKKCSEAFWSFVTSKGARLNPGYEKIPMTCESLSTFKIKAIGSFGQGKNTVRKEIEVITMDLAASANRVKNFIEDEKKQSQSAANNPNQQNPNTQNPNTTNPNNQNQQQQQNKKPQAPGKGPPRIVYWIEK